MNIRNQLILIICGVLTSMSVLAQTVTVGPPPGDALPGEMVVVPVSFTAGGTAVGSLDIDIDVNDSQFSAISVDCAVQTVGASFLFCNNDGAAMGTVSITISGNGASAFTSGLLANVTMTVDAAASAGMEPIDGIFVGAGDTTGDNDLMESDITIVDGTLTILGATYSSNPASGGGTEFPLGAFQTGTASPVQVLAITNTGPNGTTLDYNCSFTNNPDSVFLLDGGIADVGNMALAASATDNINVSCDNTKAINTYAGEFECTHDGAGPMSPVAYDVSCEITAGPEPEFTAMPGALMFDAPQEGDVIASQNITITNTGDGGTTLNSSGMGCVFSGADAGKFSFVGGDGTFSVAQGGSAVKAVACDTSVASGMAPFTAQIDCTHNGSNNPSNNAVALSCTVGPAGAATYVSTPAAGSTLDFTPGDDAIAPNDPPDLNLIIANGATDNNDNDLFVECSFSGGDSEITVDMDLSGGQAIAPNSGVDLTFSCDAAVPSVTPYEAVYVCDYGVDGSSTTGGAGSGSAQYNLTCDVRGPETEVVPTPTPGTTLSMTVAPGASSTVDVDFTEVLGEGVMPTDAFVETCSITGTDAGAFQITSPMGFPAEIGDGGTVTVIVEGTDNNAQDSYSATLECIYSDSSDQCGDAPGGLTAPCGTEASWPLSISVGGDATFRVTKEFLDGDNPTEVTVELDCNGGTILDQDKVITEGDENFVNFVVTNFQAGELECHVTEIPVPGYSPIYIPGGDSMSTSDADGCHFTAIEGGDANSCVVQNQADEVELTIVKDWIFEGGSVAADVDQGYSLNLYCDGQVISDGGNCKIIVFGDDTNSIPFSSCKFFSGNGPDTFTALIRPEYPSTSCWVEEGTNDSFVEVDNGCTNLVITAGDVERTCTVTNSVFFEGIPTLSEYGMAILALLMLGMGLVGFRRYS